MLKNNFELQLLVNGRPVNEFNHEGRVFVEGREGQEYALRIKNNSSQRILAVPTVDGLSVLNGEKGSYKSSGYIIDGYDSLTIHGWRTSDDDVAKFYFADKRNSYANRSQNGGNEGVIGVAIFYEEDWFWQYATNCSGPCCSGSTLTLSNQSMTVPEMIPQSYSVSMSAAGSELRNVSENNAKAYASSAMPSGVTQKIGTGWGEQKNSKVSRAGFNRKSHPETVLELYYNTREELESMGVQFQKPVYVAPSAFPNGYCKPPRN